MGRTLARGTGVARHRGDRGCDGRCRARCDLGARAAAIVWGAACSAASPSGALVGAAGRRRRRRRCRTGPAWALRRASTRPELAGGAVVVFRRHRATPYAGGALLAPRAGSAGALAFGGAHVALPLLERSMVDTGLDRRPARFLPRVSAAGAGGARPDVPARRLPAASGRADRRAVAAGVDAPATVAMFGRRDTCCVSSGALAPVVTATLRRCRAQSAAVAGIRYAAWSASLGAALVRSGLVPGAIGDASPTGAGACGRAARPSRGRVPAWRWWRTVAHRPAARGVRRLTIRRRMAHGGRPQATLLTSTARASGHPRGRSSRARCPSPRRLTPECPRAPPPNSGCAAARDQSSSSGRVARAISSTRRVEAVRDRDHQQPRTAQPGGSGGSPASPAPPGRDACAASDSRTRCSCSIDTQRVADVPP